MTKAKSFSSGHLFTSIISHLRNSSEGTMSSLLLDLEGSQRNSAFRLALCDRFLSTSQYGNTQARVVQKARPVARRNKDEAGTNTTSDTREQQPYPWTLPSAQRVMQALTYATQTKPMSKELEAIFYLIVDFGSMRSTDKATIGDAWSDALVKDELKSTISQIFSPTANAHPEAEILGKRTILFSLLDQWRP